MAPRLVGYKDRVGVDIPFHITSLTRQPFVRHFGPNPDDLTTVIVDVAASRADITVDMFVENHGDKEYRQRACVSGPWLLGKGNERIIYDILSVANDALQDGSEKSAMDVIAQALASKASSATALIRPVIVPVRARWYCNVSLNEGCEPGPVDVWFRTLATRDVA